jgi:hypothetical protein
MTIKPSIAGLAALLALGGCAAGGSPAGRTTVAQAAGLPGTATYDPTVKTYPDETPHVIGGQTFYFNRYTPFDLH